MMDEQDAVGLATAATDPDPHVGLVAVAALRRLGGSPGAAPGGPSARRGVVMG